MSNLVDRDQMTDREKELVDYWLEKGREHATPSKLTQKFMGEINTHLQYIREKLNDNSSEHKELLEKIEKIVCDSESKFAAKWTEDIIKWFMGIIGVGLLGVVGSVILNAIKLQ